MNDLHRQSLGLLGTAASWLSVELGAKLAALVASLATAAFMTISAVEKWEARRARLQAEKPCPATR